MSDETMNTGVDGSAALKQDPMQAPPSDFSFVPPPAQTSALAQTTPPPPPADLSNPYPKPFTTVQPGSSASPQNNDPFNLDQFAAPPTIKIVEDAPGSNIEGVSTKIHLKKRFMCLDDAFLGKLKIVSGHFDEASFNNALRGLSPSIVFTRSAEILMPSGIILFPEKGSNGAIDAYKMTDPAHKITGRNKHIYMQDMDNINKAFQAGGDPKKELDPGSYAKDFVELAKNFIPVAKKSSSDTMVLSTATAAGLSIPADALLPKGQISKYLPEIENAHQKGDRTAFYAGVAKAAAVISAAVNNVTKESPSLLKRAMGLFIKEKRGEEPAEPLKSAAQEFNIPAQGQNAGQENDGQGITPPPPSYTGGR